MEYAATSEAQAYKDGINGMFKITTIFLSIMVALILITVDVAYLLNLKSRFTPNDLTTLGSFKYSKFNSPNLGNTFSPMAKIPIHINNQTQSYEFLIDSGAIASTLPQTEASDFNLDVINLPRIIIQGVTSAPSYGYIAQAGLQLDQATITLPVIFADTDQHILGITGLFDTHTLIFDHEAQSVRITKSK